MNEQTRALFGAAAHGNTGRVRQLLLDARVDLLARDAAGRLVADCVSVGNVSMDPEDVAELHALAGELSRATERLLSVQVTGASGELAPLVRALVARIAPSAAENGGRALSVRCAPQPNAVGWRLSIHGSYAGSLPASDPPWELRAEVLVAADDEVGLLELARRLALG
jgi:hypothetical protein